MSPVDDIPNDRISKSHVQIMQPFPDNEQKNQLRHVRKNESCAAYGNYVDF